MTTDTITLTGHIGTDPRHLVTGEGVPVTSFRVATDTRRYDRDTEKWVTVETNWYTVTCFRQLAINTARSLTKGDPVIVVGTLHVREWEQDDRKGINVELEAQTIGSDLRCGAAIFTRTDSNGIAEQEPF